MSCWCGFLELLNRTDVSYLYVCVCVYVYKVFAFVYVVVDSQVEKGHC